MFAFPAAKRTLVLVMSLALLVSVSGAQAGEEKGYLGVKLQEITPSMSKALQMDEPSGVMVSEVVDDSPADMAGLEDGDVILQFNGKTISDDGDLVKAVRATSPGDNVKVVVLRGGKNKTLDVEIGKHDSKNVFFLSKDGDVHAPHYKEFEKDGNKVIVMSGDDEDFVWTMGEDMPSGLNRGYMGVHLDDLNEQMGEYFGVDGGKGALVTEIVKDSPAAKAGLKAGDVIIQLGEKEITSSGSLHKAMNDTEPEQRLEVKFVRRGQIDDTSITLGEVPENTFAKHIKILGDGDEHWSIHTAPSMMKHFDHDGDVDVRVIRRGGSDFDWDSNEWVETEGEIEEMREELDKMRQELKEMKKELQEKK